MNCISRRSFCCLSSTEKPNGILWSFYLSHAVSRALQQPPQYPLYQGMTSVMPQCVADSNGFSRWPSKPGAKHTAGKGQSVMLSEAKHLCICSAMLPWHHAAPPPDARPRTRKALPFRT